MQHRQITQTAKQITDIIESAGGKVPKPPADAFANFAKLVERADRLDVDAKLPQAVADALEADRDPATDPAVQAAAARKAFAACGLEHELNRRALLLINTHAESLLEALRTPFDKAAAVLVKAHEDLGDVDLDDTTAVLSRGGTAARSWADAQEADAVIDRIRQAWGALALAAKSVSFAAQWRLLTIADVPAAVFLEENLLNASVRPWNVLRRGWPLSLATPTTLRERIAAMDEERERRARQPADEFKAQMRRTHPPIVVGAR